MKITKNDLSSSLPIHFYDISIHKPTLEEIYKKGVDTYQEELAPLLISTDDLKKFTNQSPLDFLTMQALLNNEFLLKLQSAFFTYLKKEIVIFPSKVIVL